MRIDARTCQRPEWRELFGIREEMETVSNLSSQRAKTEVLRLLVVAVAHTGMFFTCTCSVCVVVREPVVPLWDHAGYSILSYLVGYFFRIFFSE